MTAFNRHPARKWGLGYISVGRLWLAHGHSWNSERRCGTSVTATFGRFEVGLSWKASR